MLVHSQDHNFTPSELGRVFMDLVSQGVISGNEKIITQASSAPVKHSVNVVYKDSKVSYITIN